MKSLTTDDMIPLSSEAIAIAREERLRQMKMWSFIHRLLFYSVLLSLVTVIVFFGREEQTYHQVDHLKKYFLNNKRSEVRYAQVS